MDKTTPWWKNWKSWIGILAALVIIGVIAPSNFKQAEESSGTKATESAETTPVEHEVDEASLGWAKEWALGYFEGEASIVEGPEVVPDMDAGDWYLTRINKHAGASELATWLSMQNEGNGMEQNLPVLHTVAAGVLSDEKGEGTFECYQVAGATSAAPDVPVAECTQLK